MAVHEGLTRRELLTAAGLAAGAGLLGAWPGHAEEKEGRPMLHLATNQYPWLTFYGRDKRNFDASLDEALKEIASTGLNGYEPLATSAQQVEQLTPLLKKHNLEMRSLYVNSTLHTQADAEKSYAQVLAIAEKAKAAGTRIIVTNPNPVRWGGQENKDDAQLRVQAEALNTLGQKLAGSGLTLAYHFHDAELRNAAREFHHMLVGTDPKLVTLCLDAHWVYRGAGNSAVAVSDIATLYGPRVSELHVRQSVKNVWTEALCDGDIDYAALTKQLLSANVKPHVVIEQAVEGATPKTMDAVEAHKKSAEYARRVFAGFAG